MRDKHFAYLAGLIDGDGCISAGRTFRERSNCYEYILRIEVTSSDRKTVSRLIELFGGIPCKNWIDNTLYWKWVCQVRKNQEYIFKGIIPFLVIKKQQAKLGLEFVNLGRVEDPESRLRLMTKIQTLNLHPKKESFEHSGKTAYAYVAGLIDAEGTLTIAKCNNSTSQVISISNDNTELLAEVEKLVGGKYIHSQDHHYVWNFFGTWKEKEKFLLCVLPYLVTKKEQGKILLEYVRLAKKRVPEYRKVLMEKIQALNNPVLPIRTSETTVPDTKSEDIARTS
jgi:hypothetical protein